MSDEIKIALLVKFLMEVGLNLIVGGSIVAALALCVMAIGKYLERK